MDPTRTWLRLRLTTRQSDIESLPPPVRRALELLRQGVSADELAQQLIQQRAERSLFRVRLPSNDPRWAQILALLWAVRGRSFDA